MSDVNVLGSNAALTDRHMLRYLCAGHDGKRLACHGCGCRGIGKVLAWNQPTHLSNGTWSFDAEPSSRFRIDFHSRPQARFTTALFESSCKKTQIGPGSARRCGNSCGGGCAQTCHPTKVWNGLSAASVAPVGSVELDGTV